MRDEELRRWRPIHLTIPHPQRSLEYGDRVYFVGLLDAISNMVDNVQPMVRSGTVGAIYQEGIKVTFQEQRIRGHLIDSRSISGFSGSPCWAQQEFLTRNDQGLGIQRDSMLLGMILGHLPDVGVAVVTPLEDIWETIMQNPELIADRKERAKRYRAEQDRNETAAVPDSSESFTKLDFEDALRRVSRRSSSSEPDEASSET